MTSEVCLYDADLAPFFSRVWDVFDVALAQHLITGNIGSTIDDLYVNHLSVDYQVFVCTLSVRGGML